jgi:hypothetical protein
VAWRGRRILPALVALGVLLFAGRWIAGVLADRWWAEEFSPAAVSFVTGWHFLELTLELGGILVATAWFIGHLFVVYRAIGSVQVSRHVANLEIREALTRETLLTGAVVAGLALGLLTGLGASRWAPVVALSWHGLSYDITEPVLNHDIGLYVAQLPLWRLVHGFFLLLSVLGLGICFGLYGLVGALRWTDGRPAINDHARAHLGWLLVAVALALAWGYLLEPYELIAGLDGLPDRATIDLVALSSLALTGTALMVAVTSAVWAVRARHALVAAGWLVLIFASLVAHYVLPAFNRDAAVPAIDPALSRQLEGIAFGLTELPDSTDDRLLRDGSPPHVAGLWDERAARAAASDPADSATASPAVIAGQGRRLPVWLAVRAKSGMSALAADTASTVGEPLWYRLADAHAYPIRADIRLPEDAVRPGAPAWRVEVRDRNRGVVVEPWPRRVALAWALQIAPLLSGTQEGARLLWRLSPTERLGALLPVAGWGAPVARIIDGQLVWISDGYVVSETFPLVGPVPWRRGSASAVRAGFVGVVQAETGETRIYLRPDADPLSIAWAVISAGVVLPPTQLPSEIAMALPYPADLFRLQSLVLERAPWSVGLLSGRPESGSGGNPDPPLHGWRPDLAGTRIMSVYERPLGRKIAAVLAGSTTRGRPILQLVRADSASALAAPRVLDATWARFPLYQGLVDSITSTGARGDSVTKGAFGLWWDNGQLGAYRSYFAMRSGGAPVLVWVAVAHGDKRGAGRTLQEAWANLRGAAAPTPATVPTASLNEARRWMRAADSAMRAGDWGAFGRAFDALRRTLSVTPDSTSVDSDQRRTP